MASGSKQLGLDDWLAETYAVIRQRGGDQFDAVRAVWNRNPQVVVRVLNIETRGRDIMSVVEDIAIASECAPRSVDMLFDYVVS